MTVANVDFTSQSVNSFYDFFMETELKQYLSIYLYYTKIKFGEC